jgi:hypothetical protein
MPSSRICPDRRHRTRIWTALELSSRDWRGVDITPKTVEQIDRIRRRPDLTLRTVSSENRVRACHRCSSSGPGVTGSHSTTHAVVAVCASKHVTRDPLTHPDGDHASMSSTMTPRHLGKAQAAIT